MRTSRSRLRTSALLVAGLWLGSNADAQHSALWREWNRPVAPFRIAGPLYYVGMANVTSLLVTTSQGHILVDGDFAESAGRILDNVRALGFKPEDIRILLSTHAHTDHAGGLAEIKARTGARLYAGAADAPLLARGGKGDFAFGDELAFPPVSVDVPVKDGQRVELGGITVRAIATPGHTMGCTSWAFTIDDGGTPLRVLMVGGTSAPGYKLVNNEKYPAIVSDYEQTFEKLKGEAVDLFLEGHGFSFGLEEKMARQRSFVDPEGYRARVAEAERAFHEELEKQRGLAVAAAAQDHVRVPLWPGGAPGSESRRREPEVARDYWVKNVHDPSLTVYLPAPERASGAAVVVVPGGGHRELVFKAEGEQPAEFLAGLGVAAFALKYRLARETGSTYTIEREARADVYRALRLVRSRAAEWHLDPARVGVMGFSAGGELVGLVAYGNGDGEAHAPDPVDRVNGRPDFRSSSTPVRSPCPARCRRPHPRPSWWPRPTTRAARCRRSSCCSSIATRGCRWRRTLPRRAGTASTWASVRNYGP